MSNIAKKPKPALSKDQHRFVGDVSALFMHWGMPQTEARLHAYLMLCAAPVSLDRIAEDLQMAKSSASVAARALEAYRLVQKHRVPGSKRVLYEASNNFSGRLARQSALLDTLGTLIRDRAPRVARGAAASRLRLLSEFYLAMSEAMAAPIREHEARLAKMAR